MDEHDNRGRLASWVEEQGCDKRSSLVFLSMVPEEREMVRNLGALSSRLEFAADFSRHFKLVGMLRLHVGGLFNPFGSKTKV